MTGSLFYYRIYPFGVVKNRRMRKTAEAHYYTPKPTRDGLRCISWVIDLLEQASSKS